MATPTAALPLRRSRIEHIHQLMAEIAAREHIAVHLLALMARATYYFFTLACLIAGIVTLADGRRNAAGGWGGAGLALLVILILARTAARLMRRAVRDLRAEIAVIPPPDRRPNGRPSTCRAEAPGTDRR
jgi:hypothetical protein